MTGDASPSPPLEPLAANPGFIRPPRIYLAAIVLGVGSHFLWPVHIAPPIIGVPVGASLLLAAVALYRGAARSFAAAGTPIPGNQPATAVVRNGPYRFSRNPIYLAFSLLQLGLALLVNSLSLVLTLVLAVALMAFVVIPREERYMQRLFPTEYASYKESTRRWL